MAYFSGLIAFFSYGGWALWLNKDSDVSILPALAHGLYAALLTFTTYYILMALKRVLTGRVAHEKLVTWGITTLFFILVPLCIQILLKNTHPVLTILPGLIIGQFYILGLLYIPSKISSRP